MMFILPFSDHLCLVCSPWWQKPHHRCTNSPCHAQSDDHYEDDDDHVDDDGDYDDDGDDHDANDDDHNDDGYDNDCEEGNELMNW